MFHYMIPFSSVILFTVPQADIEGDPDLYVQVVTDQQSAQSHDHQNIMIFFRVDGYDDVDGVFTTVKKVMMMMALKATTTMTKSRFLRFLRFFG